MIGWHLPDEADVSIGGADKLPSPKADGRVTFLTLTDKFSVNAAAGPHRQGHLSGSLRGRRRHRLRHVSGRGALQPRADRQRVLDAARARPADEGQADLPVDRGGPDGALPRERGSHARRRAARRRGSRSPAARAGSDTSPTTGRRTSATRCDRSTATSSRSRPRCSDRSSSATWSTQQPVRVGVRKYNGALYVSPVNTSTAPVTASFSVPGLAARELRVFSDGRVVTPMGNLVVDKFPGLGVNVYVVPPAGW